MASIKGSSNLLRDVDPGSGYSDEQIVALMEDDRRAMDEFYDTVANEEWRGTLSGCGCCGLPCSETDIWCRECQAHVSRTGPLWERTYQSRTGERCPFGNI
jgi:hypothetical protein